MPVLVGVALAGRRDPFFVLMIASQLTDFLDGYLARRLRAQSALGARLDIIGDAGNYVAGAVGLHAFYPQLLQGLGLWLAVAFGLSFCARFLVARLVAGEWIHPVPLVSAKVNFYVQSALVLALYGGVPLVAGLFPAAIATGTFESIAYVRAVHQRRGAGRGKDH